MTIKISKAKLKTYVKNCLYNSLLLKNLFIFLYKLRGRKPWSLGYSVYKYNFIKKNIEKNIFLFNDIALPSKYGYRLDERTVEYPWFFSRLKDNELKILDAGSVLNYFDILTLNNLKNRQIFILNFSNEGTVKLDNLLTYIYEDFRKISFNDDFFDAIVCISSLEHVGMDNTFLYTHDLNKKENNKYAYLKAITEFKRVLKNGGSLYLTIPYGNYKNHGWFQVFDYEMVNKAIEVFSPSNLTKTYFKYENKQWNFSDEYSCRSGYYFDIHREKIRSLETPAASQCVICLELTK